MSSAFPPGEPPRPRPIPVQQPAPARPAGPPAFVPAHSSAPVAKSSGGRTVAIVLSVIALTVLLVCGGIAALFAISVQQTVARIKQVQAEEERARQQSVQQQQRDIEQALRRQWQPPSAPEVRPEPPPQLPSSPPPPTAEELEAKLPPLDRHLKWLKEYDVAKANQAVDWLALQERDDARQAEVQTALLKKLKQSSPEQLSPLLAALVVWGDDKAIPELADLSKRYPNDATKILSLMEKLSEAQAIDAFVALLSEPEPLSTEAATALARHVDAAKPKLIPLINHRRQELRNLARKTLRDMQVADDELLAQAMADAASDETGARSSALEWLKTAQLSEENRGKVLATFATSLKDQRMTVRNVALQALIDDKSQQSSDLLLVALDDPKGPWANALAELLDRGDERVAERLEALIKEPQTMGRTLIAIRRSKGSEPVVRKVLGTCENREILRQLVFAYGDIATKESIPTLQKLARLAEREKDFGLKVAADHALANIAKRGP